MYMHMIKYTAWHGQVVIQSAALIAHVNAHTCTHTHSINFERKTFYPPENTTKLIKQI